MMARLQQNLCQHQLPEDKVSVLWFDSLAPVAFSNEVMMSQAYT